MTLKEQYKKERKRIQNFMRKAEKRGYQFNYELPAIPKKITKSSVSKLKKITPKYLYSKSVYGGEATYGEIVSGTKGKQEERKASAKKSAETRKRREQQRKDYQKKLKEKKDQEPLKTSIVTTITNYIKDLPSVKGVRLISGSYALYNIEPHKSFLLSKFNDKLDDADANGYYKQYLEYLYNYEAEILEALKPIQFASLQEQVIASFNQALQLLVQRIQTAEEAKRIEEEYNQYFESM